MKVEFQFASGEKVSVEGYAQLNLLAHAQLVERSIQSRCGGQCECGTCRVELVQGKLSMMRDQEKELLARVGVGDDGRIRLGCQCFPESSESEGDVVIRVPGERFRDARFIKPK